MLYVSYYEEYPIYEHAEGGYYYAGVQLIESERLSRRQAKKKLAEIVEELSADPEWKYDGHWTIRNHSKYIGEDCFYCIEKHEGSHESGWHPYC